MADRIMDRISTRDAFGAALSDMADRYPQLYYVSADTLKSVGGQQMYDKYPGRTLNVGISEQNMALMAAGIASCGTKVIAASYATFCSLRITEQIRTFICYPDLDVKIVAGLGGMSGDQEGVTHQGIEDVGVLRSIPNLVIVEAADAASTEVIAKKVIEHRGPVYLRLGRNKSAKVFDEAYRFEIGKANPIKTDGADAAVFVAGLATGRAKEAVELLTESGCQVQLIEMPTIKPLDQQAVLKAAKETGLIITVEDHTVIGGLGSAVAEVLSEFCPTSLVRIGINDQFTESADHDELLDKYNLSPEHIAKTIINAVKTKSMER